MFLSNGNLVTVKTPLSISDGSNYWPWVPPMSSPTWPSAYAGMYERQLWVYVVVSKRAKATARLPLPVYERDELNRPRVDDHPMARLLREPNPAQSGFDLLLWTSSTWDIFGRTFWLKQRNRGTVTGLYPLHPSSMTYDAEKNLWRFDNGKLRLDVKPEDLVVFKSFHPHSQIEGMSPLEPLRATLENEWNARMATSSFWQRGARPGTALVHPGSLTSDAQDRLRRQFDATHGGSDKTGSTLVLEEGMKPQKLDLTAEEAQYIETRKLNREEVCAAYDIPPPVVHILDHATFSNITEQMRSMYRDTMAPHLRAFEAAIELDLRSAEWPNDDVYAEFLMDEVLRGDFETRQEALNQANYMTLAEKRRIENLPFIEGTDRIFLNAADVPMSAPPDGDAPPPPPFQQVGLPALVDAGVITREDARQLLGIEGPVPDVPDSLPEAVSRSVMGRLSWQKELADVDADALTAGLSTDHAETVKRALADEASAKGTVDGLRHRLRATATKTEQSARLKATVTDSHVSTVTSTLRSFFKRQGDAVLASGSLDRRKWDKELADDLHATAVAVSSAIGKAALRTLDFPSDLYDVSRTVDFLRSVAERYASNINSTTKAQMDVADDPVEVFAQARDTRAEGIATGVTANVAGFAVVEAGRRVAERDGGRAPTKTWITGPNPRPAHAAMDGETVALSEDFSNGLAWPGSFGDVEEVAGCNCTVEIEF